MNQYAEVKKTIQNMISLQISTTKYVNFQTKVLTNLPCSREGGFYLMKK